MFEEIKFSEQIKSELKFNFYNFNQTHILLRFILILIGFMSLLADLLLLACVFVYYTIKKRT